jgi:hypothetical protein
MLALACQVKEMSTLRSYHVWQCDAQCFYKIIFQLKMHQNNIFSYIF